MIHYLYNLDQTEVKGTELNAQKYPNKLYELSYEERLQRSWFCLWDYLLDFYNGPLQNTQIKQLFDPRRPGEPGIKPLFFFS